MMKKLLNASMILALVVSFQGCGKKSKSSGSKAPTPPVTPPVVAELPTETLVKAILKGDAEQVSKAIQAGGDVDFRLNTGDTLLTHIIKNPQTAQETIVNLLLEAGASTEKKDQEGLTPIVIAVQNQKSNLVSLLLAYKAQVDEKDKLGNTTLMLSIALGNENLARLLISNGANIYLKNDAGQTALDIARASSLPGLADFIAAMIHIDQDVPNQSTLLSVIERGDLETLKQLASKYPELFKEEQPISPLVVAMRFEEETPNIGAQMIEVLIAAGVPVDGNSTDSRRTPLLEAVASKKTEYAVLLLANNADSNKRDDQGWNSLLHAINVNNLTLVEQFLGKKTERKYSHKMKNGKKVSFSACGFADRVRKQVKKDPEQKNINKEIRKVLKCGFYIFTK